MADDLEWYWVDNGGTQQGPTNKAGVKAAYESKKTNMDCLCWNENMENWTAMKDVPAIANFLLPAVPAKVPPKPTGRPTVSGPSVPPTKEAPKGAAPAAPKLESPKDDPVPAPAKSGGLDLKSQLAAAAQRRASTTPPKDPSEKPTGPGPIPAKRTEGPADPTKGPGAAGPLGFDPRVGLAGLKKTGGAGAGPKKPDDSKPAPAKTSAPAGPKVETKKPVENKKQPMSPRKIAVPAAKKESGKASAGGTPSKAPAKSAGSATPAKKSEPAKPAEPEVKKEPDPYDTEAFWHELMTPEGIPYYHNKHTNAVSWDKPDCLKGAHEVDKAGHWVWIPHEKDAFQPAKMCEKYPDGRTEVELENGSTTFLAASVKLVDLSWSTLKRSLVRDLVLLDEMNEPLILYNLKERFAKNEIYTNIGTILISANPYVRLPLYTPTVIDEYRHRGNKQLPPHVFTIADDAYNNLIEWRRSQSIVISGESGAGKTECTKQCLQYLAEVAGSQSNVEQRILLSNPILEAFGNAKTVRNNNSSRFGKYVEITFDKQGGISGAKTTNYLLEKSRVVGQSGDERNYHVFYQLCAGADASTRKALMLKDALSYGYLNQSGNVTIDDVDDVKEFEEMTAAMDKLGFAADEKKQILQIVAAVTHLGNVTFKSLGEKKCDIEGKTGADEAAQLLEVPFPELKKAVVTRIVAVKGQAPIEVFLGVGEAEAARNALSKFVYARLFDWLVQRINTAIGVGKGDTQRTIGILDIFGFEIFKLNSFEQLCINFTNEKLQQFFNAHTFKKEEAVYRQEKIDFEHVEYIDNQPVLDLIEKKPNGIIPTLDEELRIPKGTDQTFVAKLHAKCKGLQHYQAIISAPDTFVVRHYAGDVTYHSQDFLQKNADRLLDDLYTLLSTSKAKLLKELFPPVVKKDVGADDSKNKQTLGEKFQGQLNDLMTTLNNTEPHYIRCIKPNNMKAPLEFEGNLVLQQLRYSGVFEAVKIRKSGYPFRFTHEEFMKRFKCIMPKKKWADAKAACFELIKEMKQDLKEVQVGVTRVLYRAQQHKTIELIRNVAVEKTVIFLQKHVRAYYARKLHKRLKKLKPVLEAAMKTRTLAALDAALEQAAGLPFPLLQWEQAKKLKILVVEEIRVTKLLEDLVAQDPEKVFEQLSKAIAAANEINLATPLAEKARKLLEEISDRRKTRAWLKEGVEEADEKKLDWAISKAKELKMEASVTAPLSAAKEMKDRIVNEKKIIEKLVKAIATGPFLKEGDKPDPAPLKSPIEEAKKFGMKTVEGKKQEKLANILQDMRTKLLKALGTKEKDLWKAVEQVVIGSGDEFKDQPEVIATREEVAHQAAVEEVCERLYKASQELDQDQLHFGLEQAKQLKVDEAKYDIIPVAREYLNRIIETRRLMTEATAAVDEEQLIYAVEYADSFNYNTEEVQKCRALRDNVMQINVEAAYACKMLEEDPMRDLLERADAINLHTEHIEKIRTLILNTPEEKFVQLQLKAAVANNDPDRVIRVTIKLKDQVFKKSAAMFAFDNYPKLRSRVGWANMKLLTLKREALAAGMREHTKSPIHTALSEMDSKKAKIATRMFKNIMGFMGDRAYESPMLLAEEVLRTAIQEAWLRPEIYCQIIKQLTKNPSPESLKRGWQMMSLCLESFPPGEEMENYLEMWLRSTAQPADKYVRMLHTTVYGGARTVAPTQQEMQRIIDGETLRHATFEQKREYVAPKAKIPPKGGFPKETGGDTKDEGAGTAESKDDGSASVTGEGLETKSQAGDKRGYVAPPSTRPPGAPELDEAKEEEGTAVGEVINGWGIAIHPETNQEYYYNVETGEVTWDKPAELLEGGDA